VSPAPQSGIGSAPGAELDGHALESVLVAEDDPIFRHVLQTWLGKWNYKVVAADNGQEAWQILQQEDSPKMAILDWMMPETDGLELCRRLRSCELGPYRYVLLVTARDEKQDVVAGLEAGADDYLAKPFNVEELRARLRSGERILHLQDALLRAQKALQFEAAHDRLTGLWNRGAILDRLHSEMERHHRTGDALGVMMADLDHFKRINDSYGHLAGDEVLQQVAARLSDALRGYDSVGRYGGEEFLVVVPGCAASDLMTGAERLRSCISAKPMQTGNGPIAATLSLGVVSTQTVATRDYETLLRVADEALYAAKAKGRNRVETAPIASWVEK
jgi:diguanylate cyclase (GGDEF)-like protein